MQNNQVILGSESVAYTTKSKSVLWYAWMSFLMFLYIYEFNFDVFGLSTYYTSRRVVVFVLLVQALFRRKKDSFPQGIAKKTFTNVVWLHVFLFLYSFFLIVIIGRGVGSHISDNIIRLFMFGLLPVWCLYQFFDSVEEFLRVILIVTVVQAGFIIASLVNPSFGEMLDTTFAVSEKSEYIMDHRRGYAGGLACITAPGCLRFSMGLVAAFYFALKRNDVLSILLFVILGIICSMVARTGMFISLVGLFLMSIQKGSNNIVKYIISLFVVGLVVLFTTNRINVLEFFDFYRMQDLLFAEGGSSFVEGYLGGENTRIPPLTFETFFLGTGITSGVSGTGIPVNVDGGFFRIYAAYGLVMCVFFYFIMFKNFFRNINGTKEKTLKTTLLFFIIVILMGEFKEFTIYQQYMVCLFFTFATLINKQQNNTIKNVSL